MAYTESWAFNVAWIASAAVFYEIAQAVLARFFFSSLSTRYRNFTSEKKTAWNIRFASITNSIVIAGLCVYSLCQPEVWRDPMRIDISAVRVCVCIAFGYFITDLYWMMSYPVESGAALSYKLHHLFSMAGFFVVLGYEALGLFVTMRLMSELSQPFVHLRSFYRDCECQSNGIYLLNALCFTAVFTIFRVLAQPLFYMKVYEVVGTDAWNRIDIFSHFVWLGVGGFLDILNIFWFVLVVRGLWKIIRRTSIESVT